MRIEISARMAPINEQLENHGLKLIQPSKDVVDMLTKAVVTLESHEIITSKEADRASERLIKTIKVEALES
jgi:hypothetical protein